MLEIARRTVGLWWRTWPLLVAIFLVGWLARYWLLQLAIEIGINWGNLWAYLVLPLAPLTRLLSYLAMFLVLRSVTPGLRTATMHRAGARSLIDIVLGAIVPFLVLYTTWKLIEEDYFVYLTSVQYRGLYESTGADFAAQLASDAGAWFWVLIGVAFVLRSVLARLRERLPGWTAIVIAYLDAVWLFLTLTAAARAVFGSPQWILERRIVVWLTDTKDDVVARFGVLGQLWDGSVAVVVALATVVGLSLTWVALASVVFGTPFTPTWDSARRAMLGHRGGERLGGVVERGQNAVRPWWQRVPAGLRSRLVELVREQLARFGPLVDAVRLILHGGAVPIAFFVLGYATLTVLAPSGAYFSGAVTDGYLWRAVALVIGPHEWLWWETYREPIRVAIGAVIDPLRIALIAATFWYCVDRTLASREPDHVAV